MSVRKTKVVWMFHTSGAQVVYENKADLDADLALCEQIVGVKPECTVTELTMVLSSGVSTVAPTRKKVEYSAEFEAFWKTHEPKRRKEQTYQEWLKDHGTSPS